MSAFSGALMSLLYHNVFFVQEDLDEFGEYIASLRHAVKACWLFGSFSLPSQLRKPSLSDIFTKLLI